MMTRKFTIYYVPFFSRVSEWIDFPRGDQRLPNGKVIPGNNYSLDKCRRRFDLVSFMDDAIYLRMYTRLWFAIVYTCIGMVRRFCFGRRIKVKVLEKFLTNL